MEVGQLEEVFSYPSIDYDIQVKLEHTQVFARY